MFKKRLKGLLAMVLAGSIATTALPLSASATISSNFIYDGAAPSKTLQQLCAENSFEGTLCAVYATKTDDSSDPQLTATYGNDEISTECSRIESLSESYDVKIKTRHKLLVTTDDPATTDISANPPSDVFSFPKTISLSDYTISPLEKFSTWSTYYGVVSGDNINSGSLQQTGTDSTIADGDISISVSADTIKALYSTNGIGKSDLFNNGVTIIKLNTDYKTFDIPVLNAFGEQEKDGNDNDIKISITQGSTGFIDNEKPFYLCYGNEVQGDRVSTKDELWNKIVTLAGNERDSFNDEQLFLLRYAEVTVSGNGGDKGNFTSREYYNYLKSGTPNNDAIKYAFIDAKPKSIWSVVVSFYQKRYSADQGHIDGAIKACLRENPKANSINFIEQTTIDVTGTTPTAGGEISSDNKISPQILKDDGSPKTISELLAELPAPASGKKYDLNGWQLWRATPGSGLSELQKIEFNTSGVTGVTAEMFNKAGYSKCPVIYFPQVDNTPSTPGGSGGSSSRPEPSYDPNKPTIDGEEKSWSDVAKEIGKLGEGENKTITLGRDKTIPADVIEAIKDSKAIITFKINSAFSWTVDGSTLTDGDIHDYDFSIEVITATGVEILRGDVGVGFKIGDISDGATLNINFKKEHAQKFANLYKKVDGELVFVDNVKIDENGAAIGLEVTEAGEYVVMLGKMSDRPGDMDNDGIMNAKDSLAILKDFLGMESGANPLVSDMNGDSFINAKDALIIVKKSVGIE